MNKRQIISFLISIADKLDESGYVPECNSVTVVAERILKAQLSFDDQDYSGTLGAYDTESDSLPLGYIHCPNCGQVASIEDIKEFGGSGCSNCMS